MSKESSAMEPDEAPVAPSRRSVLRATAGLGALAVASVSPAGSAWASTSDPLLSLTTDDITPFRLAVPSRELLALRLRLAETRWPERETVEDASQGAQLERMQALVEHWRTRYDWRRCEARLNALGQFRTRIDGLGIHFLHVRSRHAGALPLLMTHGWPGSVVEFLEVMGPLTDPTRFGGRAQDAFHVVLPSLPGFGFSDKPTDTGWNLPRIARAWDVLMTRLGYGHYVAQGGDLGAGVATYLGVQRPAGLLGLHLNLPILFPPPLEGAPNEEELAAIAQLTRYDQELSAYAKLQNTRPQTLGYGLTDSPVGQAAWIYEKFAAWTDSQGEPERVLSRDEMLDDIMVYWLTGTAASSARLYWESFTKHLVTTPVDVPVAVSLFPGELYVPPRVWGERTYSRLFYWNKVERGGHFAAFEQPGLFVRELRESLRALR